MNQESVRVGLRFDPMGGGQFKQAVQQIIEAESQPIKQLQARKAQEDTRLKLFQEFKTKFQGLDKALGELSSFRSFRELKADLGDGSALASVTIDKDKASPGNYQVEINQLAARSSSISNGHASPDTPSMGQGFITLETPDGDSREVYVDEKNSSLRGIANQINNQADFPVRASVVQDVSDKDKSWKLILTAKNEGAANQISFPEFYFLDGDEDFYMDDNHEAQNAKIKVDGFEIEAPNNGIQDFLPGVNLNLKQAKDGQPITLSITEDFQKISGKVKNFVDKANEILGFITKQNSVDDKSDTRTSFAGDTGLQNVEFRLRNLLQEGFPVYAEGKDDPKVYVLSDFGIEFDKSGQLNFKEDKFQKFMEKNFESLSQVFTGDQGLATQMKVMLSGYTTPGVGMLAQREQSMRNRIKQIDTDIDNKSRMLDRRQQTLTEQFSRLEASLSAMQKQQQYLSSALPSGGGGGLMSLLGG
ncbi:MAG: flagellar filament capping protein FliD [Oligoflexia bacterium]|nr:flagellar filament capping protein FliD [Oligoflexia bacterium]